MTSEEIENRTFLENLFGVLAHEGWGKTFIDALSEDVIFNAMGRSPIAGRYQGKTIYITEVLDRLHGRLAVSPKLSLLRIIVQGDLACVQFHSHGGEGINGADFSMDYCWLVRMADNKIVEIWGYYDTGKMIALFEDL